MRISASRGVPASTQRKLDVKKLRLQRTAESFAALLADKLCQLQSSSDHIGLLDYYATREDSGVEIPLPINNKVRIAI